MVAEPHPQSLLSKDELNKIRVANKKQIRIDTVAPDITEQK